MSYKKKIEFKNVSRETISKLETYQALLEKWQQKVNLVSHSTTPQLWERHFIDSLQLTTYLSDEPLDVIDLGSGAGFPGLVLAIARPHSLSVSLIESDLKKCVFLENVSRETMTPVTILRERIEKLQGKIKGDVITARGVAPLSLLLSYAAPLMKDQSFCLFLKGKEYGTEIQEVKKKWEFELEIFVSITDARSRILKIKHPQRISHDKNNCGR